MPVVMFDLSQDWGYRVRIKPDLSRTYARSVNNNAESMVNYPLRSLGNTNHMVRTFNPNLHRIPRKPSRLTLSTRTGI